VLECAKAEYIRRVLAPYEAKKVADRNNVDPYNTALLNQVLGVDR
jgi:hypothetical protein